MEIFLTSIQSIVPIIVIIILGYFLQVRGWFKESFGNDLSKLIMNVAMPVAIFTSVLKYLTLDNCHAGECGRRFADLYHHRRHDQHCRGGQTHGLRSSAVGCL